MQPGYRKNAVSGVGLGVLDFGAVVEGENYEPIGMDCAVVDQHMADVFTKAFDGTLLFDNRTQVVHGLEFFPLNSSIFSVSAHSVDLLFDIRSQTGRTAFVRALVLGVAFVVLDFFGHQC